MRDESGGHLNQDRASGSAPRLLAIGVVAMMLAPSAAAAETPSVRLGALALQPYTFLQLDAGGSFGPAPQDYHQSGFNPRRARLGVKANIAKPIRLGFIWDFGGTPSHPCVASSP